ncbi:MAG: TFIIB-type zinc ribbon-containing protein [Thermoprotei archaeon]|nr:TFIIB-type zinc ribbon-containing protein [Thermoprotei archaeon]
MICRFCGSTAIVWDSVLGVTVCSSCGSIVEENAVDDGASSLHGFGVVKARGRLASRAPAVLGSRLESPANRRALNLIRGSSVVREVKALVDGVPTLKSRTLRVRVALALYLICRSLGYSKAKSRLYASRAVGVSERSVASVEAKHPIVEGRLLAAVRDRLAGRRGGSIMFEILEGRLTGRKLSHVEREPQEVEL